MGGEASKPIKFHKAIYESDFDKVKQLIKQEPEFYLNCDAGAEASTENHLNAFHPLESCVLERCGAGISFVSLEQFTTGALSDQGTSYQIAEYLLQFSEANKDKSEQLRSETGIKTAICDPSKGNPRNKFKNAFQLACERFDYPMIKLFLKYNCNALQSASESTAAGGGRTFSPFTRLCYEAGRIQSLDLMNLKYKLGIDSKAEEDLTYKIESRAKLVHACITEILAESSGFPRGTSANEAKLRVMDDGKGNSPLHLLAEGALFESIAELFTVGFHANMTTESTNGTAADIALYRLCVISLVPRPSKRTASSSSVVLDAEELRFVTQSLPAKRFLQTLRLLLSNEKYDSDEQRLMQRSRYARLACKFSADYRYGKHTFTKEEIETTEPLTPLYEVIVNLKCPAAKYKDAVIYSSWLENGNSKPNIESFFGENGFYSKYM